MRMGIKLMGNRYISRGSNLSEMFLSPSVKEFTGSKFFPYSIDPFSVAF